jgi:hypothetical protein
MAMKLKEQEPQRLITGNYMGEQTGQALNLYDHLHDTLGTLMPRLAGAERALLAEDGRLLVSCGRETVKADQDWTFREIADYFAKKQQNGALTVHMNAEAIGGNPTSSPCAEVRP